MIVSVTNPLQYYISMYHYTETKDSLRLPDHAAKDDACGTSGCHSQLI